MKPAIDAAHAFVVALEADQQIVLDRLEEIIKALAAEGRRISERETEVITLVRDKAQFSRQYVESAMKDVLALAAIVRDGSDDMAKAMAGILGPKVEPLGEADEETVALAQRLAPVREAAE